MKAGRFFMCDSCKIMTELNESSLTSISDFKVTSADTDMFSRLRPGAAVNYLIQAAINSADSLGFGYGGIRHQNLYWVLSRMTFELYRPLKWYEKVKVETWPKNVERILYLRDYLLLDSANNIIGRATSGWLAIDLKTKKLKKIDGIHADFFVHLKDKHALVEPPEKLFPVDKGESFEIRSGYFDIDLNGHVTTTRYVDWMMDTFPVDFHKDNYPHKLSLNMMKEIMPGEKIILTRNRKGVSGYLFEGVKSDTGTIAFRAIVEF